MNEEMNVRKEIETGRRYNWVDYDEIEVYGSSYDKVSKEFMYQFYRRGYATTRNIQWHTPPTYTVNSDGVWRCYAKFHAW